MGGSPSADHRFGALAIWEAPESSALFFVSFSLSLQGRKSSGKDATRRAGSRHGGGDKGRTSGG
eukprot:1389418-Heterocapsa_arctica.AAC.1